MRPVVEMAPTTFRTYRLGAIGTPRASIRIAQSAPWSQRVLVTQNTGATGAFIGAGASADFETPGTTVPGNGFELPVGGVPNVFVVEPGQHLVAVGTTDPDVDPTRISVSVSAWIPTPRAWRRSRRQPVTYRQQRVEVLGGGRISRIVPIDDVPRRVIIDVPAALSTFFATDANELAPVHATNPGNAYEVRVPVQQGSQDVTFILAPGQALFGAREQSITALQVSVGEIDLSALRGPTGIPGPDSEE